MSNEERGDCKTCKHENEPRRFHRCMPKCYYEPNPEFSIYCKSCNSMRVFDKELERHFYKNTTFWNCSKCKGTLMIIHSGDWNLKIIQQKEIDESAKK